jgi:uncharacterized protein GlcG (DUF336 family)
LPPVAGAADRIPSVGDDVVLPNSRGRNSRPIPVYSTGRMPQSGTEADRSPGKCRTPCPDDADDNFIVMPDTPHLPGLASADADWLVREALAVGAERGFPPLAVAVVDVAGEVIVLRRADGGMPMTSRIAVAKARTALLALKPSGLIDLPGGIVDSIQHLFGGDFVPWAGGVLITDGEVILAAAGASGAHALEDEEAVQTAVRRWQDSRRGDTQN